MEHVQAKWASISLRNDLFRPDHFEGIGDFELEIPTFTNVQDRFISGLLHEFTKLLAWDGSLEPRSIGGIPAPGFPGDNRQDAVGIHQR
jgi:hypothetical protein